MFIEIHASDFRFRFICGILLKASSCDIWDDLQEFVLIYIGFKWRWSALKPGTIIKRRKDKNTKEGNGRGVNSEMDVFKLKKKLKKREDSDLAYL